MDDKTAEIRTLVLERMDLSRDMSDQEIADLIGAVSSQVLRENYLSVRERVRIEQKVFNSLRRLDVLQELLDDPEVSEIMVNGPKHIFYEKNGCMEEWDQTFSDEEKMHDVIQQIAGTHAL